MRIESIQSTAQMNRSSPSWKSGEFSRFGVCGFTLIELLVVIAIISILMGLLFPAVQTVRESARRTTCQNHLRQWGLAGQNYESTFEYLPGPWFNALMDQPGYNRDRGIFVQMLPFVEEQNRFDRLQSASTTFDIANQSILSESFKLLSCPSAADPAVLNNIATTFSGAAIEGLTTISSDYVGNGGYSSAFGIDPALTDGPIGVQIAGSVIPKETSARVTDGLSNTLMFWESIGSVVITRTGRTNVEDDLDTHVDSSFTLTVFGAPTLTFPSSGAASNKSYLHSWAGLRLGNIRAIGGQVVNIGNRIQEPCSRHPGGAYAVAVDGSVRLLRDDIAPQIAFALASARGHEFVAAE